MNELRHFVPQVLAADESFVWVTVALQLNRCQSCQVPMLPKLDEHRPFFHSYQPTLAEQMVRAGWHRQSNFQLEHGYICEDCVRSETPVIRCQCCQMMRKASQVQEAFGDPPEYLCSVCYETVPAKAWEQMVEQLEESHRYDWE